MKDTKNILFIVFGLSFLGGIFTNNILDNYIVGIIVLSFLIILFLNFYIFTQRYFLRETFILLGLLLGIFISNYTLQEVNNSVERLGNYYNNKHKFKLKILDIYKVGEFKKEYKTELLSVSDKKIVTINGLISIPSNFTIAKGDIIESYARLKKIQNFNNNFNYEKFMYSKKLFFTIKAESINKIEHINSHIIIKKIASIREISLAKIYNFYPEEEAIFLGGILLGARESLPQDLKNDFNASGLTHFIAVSGFNITILIVFLSYILKLLPVFVRTVIVTIVIILFTLLVGEAAPVIRASIMGLIAYYIMVSGRNIHNLALLLFTAVIMVVLSPLSLNYDVSFHLSFLAVIGIIYTQKFWKKMFYFLPETLAIKEAFVLTLSALVFALPVMVFNFGQLSIMAPFANIAVTWTIPLAMLGGFISILVDFVSQPTAQFFAYITWVLLAWDIKVVHFFGGLDWAVMKYNFGVWRHSLEFLYFLVIIFIINYFQRKEN